MTMFDRGEVLVTLKGAFLQGFEGFLDKWDDRIDGSVGDAWENMADAVLALTRPISARQTNRLRDLLAEALGWNGGEDDPDYEKAGVALDVVLDFFGLVEAEGDVEPWMVAVRDVRDVGVTGYPVKSFTVNDQVEWHLVVDRD